MGKFLRNTLLFLLPFAGVLGWLWHDTPAIAYRYMMVQKDCRTGMWIYHRLYESALPIDVAFIGTSKTMCDVDDVLLEQRLRSERARDLHVANLGVCRIGENLHWWVARELFAKKPPRYLIKEVSTDLRFNSHFHFPYVSSAADVLSAPMVINPDYLGDIVDMSWYRLVYQHERLLGVTRSYEEPLTDSAHSFLYIQGDMVADPAQMARVKEKRARNLGPGLPQGAARWYYDLAARHPKHYLEDLKAMCDAHGTQLIFLYLPVYGAAAAQPQEIDYLQGLGTVWIPPDSIFQNPELHFDDSHLNQAGARKLSDWLVDQCAALPPAQNSK